MMGTPLEDAWSTGITTNPTNNFINWQGTIIEKPEYPPNFLDVHPDPLQGNDLTTNNILQAFKEKKQTHEKLTAEVKSLEDDLKKYNTVKKEFYEKIEEFTLVLRSRFLLTNEQNNDLTDSVLKLKNRLEPIQNHYSSTLFNLLHESGKKLKNTTESLIPYQEFLKTGVREILGNDVKQNTCSICLEREINVACVPCGHTFCTGCKGKMGKSCPTCRQNIEKTITLYFSL